MAGEHPDPVEALGQPPGWTHKKPMRDWVRRQLREIPQTERIAGAVDRTLQKEVQRINAVSTNRTGLRDSLAALKDRAAQSRQKSMEAGEKIEAAFKRQAEATESLNRYADEVTREADDVLAELGQFGNGAPE